ncbi:MAG: ABC transporter ATP-binding protein [Methyloligella sp.]|nr:MAG: ABC transporter ATP-binding protein [Methyloligella sp.]
MKVVLTDMIGFFKTFLPKGKKAQVETKFAVPREQSPLINGANRQPAQRGAHPFEAGGLTGDTPFSPPPQPGFQDNGAQQLPPSFQGQAHEQPQQAPSSHVPLQVSGQLSGQGSVQPYGQNQVIGQPQPQNQFQNTPQFAAGHQNQIDAHPQAGWLTANKVCKTYGKRQVVKQASIRVQRGESVGLLGPNGAGKTTIFYMITGLVKADEGMIHIDGYDVTALPMYRRARLGIGYLPQEASIFRGLTVEQNIMAVLEVTQKNKKKRLEKLESLLDEFNITRLRKSPSIALSGGERRRCEIARALASDPSYILLDEPFAGIDPIAIGDIRDLVRHLTDRGIGVLITDHNVRETLEMIDRAYIIHDGKVLTEGTPQEIVSNDDVRRVYLGDMFG